MLISYIINIQWINIKNGIIDKTWWGLNYASGTSIILSKKAFNKLRFKPKYNLNSLIKDMIDSDLLLAKKEINS